MKINPCPICGSPAKLDSGGVIECYGYDWQNLYIECTDVNDKHCGMELNLQTDFFKIKYNEEILITAWNSLENK